MVNFTLNSKLIYLHIEMVYSILFFKGVCWSWQVLDTRGLVIFQQINPYSADKIGAFFILIGQYPMDRNLLTEQIIHSSYSRAQVMKWKSFQNLWQAVWFQEPNNDNNNSNNNNKLISWG